MKDNSVLQAGAPEHKRWDKDTREEEVSRAARTARREGTVIQLSETFL